MLYVNIYISMQTTFFRKLVIRQKFNNFLHLGTNYNQRDKNAKIDRTKSDLIRLNQDHFTTGIF